MNAVSGESGMAQLLAVVRQLRGEQGCPWDREQTLVSLKPFLIEECYELIDAIDDDDVEQHREELGDVLLQVVLQAQIRAETGAFEFDDVARQLAEKLIRRHPHVFGDARAETSADVIRNWEAIKSGEKQRAGKSCARFEGLPRHLPALQRAQRVQSRASRTGFDWDDVSDVICKVEEELAETREALTLGDVEGLKEEIGDLLFATVNLSRFQKISAEEALDGAVRKFVSRFLDVEQRIHASGRTLDDCTLAEMDAEWDNVKAERKASPGN